LTDGGITIEGVSISILQLDALKKGGRVDGDSNKTQNKKGRNIRHTKHRPE
jgi:hypothetical protein